MLVEFQVQNVYSFNQKQVFSMVASSATQEVMEELNTLPVGQFGIDKLLSSAAVFGANASGKSNLVSALALFRNCVLRSLSSNEENLLSRVTPFILKPNFYDMPSEFEVSFVVEQKLYRYGLAIEDGEITEEWLFWNANKRETELFHREGQKIKFNANSFSEAEDFVVKQDDGSFEVDKTRKNVPFISVLAQFDMSISSVLVKWFLSLKIVSGLEEFGYRRFTIEQFENNPEFKTWALSVFKTVCSL